MSNQKRAPTLFSNDRKVRTSRVLYRGRTWAVTGYGIERHVGHAYFIKKDRLLEKRPGSDGRILDWPMHMAEKGADYDYIDFLHCFVKAFDLFQVEVAPDMLRNSLEKGLAEHLKHIGCSLRNLHREPIERPIRAKVPDMLLAYRASDLALYQSNWLKGWGEPCPMLVKTVADRVGKESQP